MDENKKLGDEQLENVSGGGSPHIPVCRFTFAGEQRVDIHGKLWALCASFCGLWPNTCACHGQNDRCDYKWHLINKTTEELEPPGAANHADKLKSNNYNT